MHPIDWIEQNKGKRIRIVLRTGRVYTGIFVNYDATVNVLVDDLFCLNTKTHAGRSLLNGTTVAYIESIPS
ncbi:U6 snRNA-associated Sm-like protein LSm5 [Nematocida minor]|uniref:U6 snRNA-associated Sm-like protein LSm5 n=1 Tax=Nematocida minor TaxID=1912983 RepID=UPI00221E3C94|nr:U6 snRNA-associated Sm-like protein LSm5 [Nematocida minor]KAI5189354.1 U6 snRNA-associated Sm-like protein LSm5 [Nematocida minor]